MKEFEATATFISGKISTFVLDESQVNDFMLAVYNKLVYKDEKNDVMVWLPPDQLLHLVIKPTLESPKCQKNQPLDQESDLLTSPNQ